MRYVTVRAEPPAGEGFHPIGRAATDDPGVGHLVGRLTARQREVLSAATVGEHLRKVERRVFSTLVEADAG
jgi:predicted DNA binding protein